MHLEEGLRRQENCFIHTRKEGKEKKNEKCEDEWYEIDKKENGFCEIRKDAI